MKKTHLLLDINGNTECGLNTLKLNYDKHALTQFPELVTCKECKSKINNLEHIKINKSEKRILGKNY